MSLIIGHFMLIDEPDGTTTVYDQDLDEDAIEQREEDGDDPWVFSGPPADARAFVFGELGEVDPDLDDEPCERVAQKAPCKQCPFRRKAAPGWLGQSSPEGFVGTMLIGMEPLPCHSTINYERDDWRERWLSQRYPGAKLCAGALTLMANVGKLPEGPSLPPDRAHVFATYAEFIEHHRAAKVRSWTDEEHERVGLDQVRKYVGLPVLPAKPR